ncbi:PP2C family protein-serine/threonine phosphatase [Roseicyclus marinus]|uniref:PP2C family protein-serine/threonine phosphatase n=1 Tax=Roseicyclus marinus TaxID=2161673 RepID=UPI0024105780|nr:PP2C family protein-serine/threonine phosphatase [Roseicyclus marinus]MDG3039782.1 PP2C family protein-serine/threonine phosphatase [Roseicyclus marinus]
MTIDEGHIRSGVRWVTGRATAAPSDEARPPRYFKMAERMATSRRGLTLRFALLAVTSLFGLGLLGAVAINGVQSLETLRNYRIERDIDLTRRAIRSAMIDAEIAARQIRYTDLGVDQLGDPMGLLQGVIARTATARDLAEMRGDSIGATRLSDLLEEAEALRTRLSASGETGASDRRQIATDLDFLAGAYADQRRVTSGRLHLVDVQMAMLHLVRDRTIERHQNLEVITDIVIDALTGDRPLSEGSVRTLDRALIRLQAPDLELISTLEHNIDIPIGAHQVLSEVIRAGYSSDLEAVAAQLADGTANPTVVARWLERLEQADFLIRNILEETDRIASAHIADRIDRAARDATIATIGGLAVLLIYGLAIMMIVRQLLLPMAALRDTLMRLAGGDLRPIEDHATRFVDVRAVMDALRVFRIDAIRRDRLEQERRKLTGDLTAANREMRADLDAAAALQLAQLPQPGTIGPFRFFTFFRASNHLGGDSFDYFSLPDGRVVLFELDVAGHGTAACLVATAAHTGLKRSLQEMGDGIGPIDILRDFNADWRDDLPYLTALVMFVDPETGTGRMAQAGHPNPLLVPAEGAVQWLGTGGLPIGVSATPDYEESPFQLAPGDRLFVFSDGIYEVQNPAGTVFGEERLADIIRSARTRPNDILVHDILAALTSWAGKPLLNDDISLIVMERT